MSIPKNLAAYTTLAPGYPPYVSINEVAGGHIQITVRSPVTSTGECGSTSAVVLTPIEFEGVLAQMLRSWMARAAPEDEPHLQAQVVGDALVVRLPLDLLAFAAEHVPFVHHVGPEVEQTEEERAAGALRVTDQHAFGESVAASLTDERGEDGTTFLHEALDDAIEDVVERADPGFVWPAAGLKSEGSQ